MHCTKNAPVDVGLSHNAPPPLQAAIALGVSALAVGYIGRLASKAVSDYESEHDT